MLYGVRGIDLDLSSVSFWFRLLSTPLHLTQNSDYLTRRKICWERRASACRHICLWLVRRRKCLDLWGGGSETRRPPGTVERKSKTTWRLWNKEWSSAPTRNVNWKRKWLLWRNRTPLSLVSWRGCRNSSQMVQDRMRVQERVLWYVTITSSLIANQLLIAPHSYHLLFVDPGIVIRPRVVAQLRITHG